MATFVKRKPAKLVVVDPPLPIQKVVFDESSVLFTSLTSFAPALICMVMVWLPPGFVVGVLLGVGDDTGVFVGLGVAVGLMGVFVGFGVAVGLTGVLVGRGVALGVTGVLVGLDDPPAVNRP